MYQRLPALWFCLQKTNENVKKHSRQLPAISASRNNAPVTPDAGLSNSYLSLNNLFTISIINPYRVNEILIRNLEQTSNSIVDQKKKIKKVACSYPPTHKLNTKWSNSEIVSSIHKQTEPTDRPPPSINLSIAEMSDSHSFQTTEKNIAQYSQPIQPRSNDPNRERMAYQSGRCGETRWH